MTETQTGEPWSFEVCQDCGLPNIVGFTVAHEIWEAVMGDRDAPGIFCIRCFDQRAAARGVAWDQQPVNWWPISSVSNALWGGQKQYTMQEQIAQLEVALNAEHTARIRAEEALRKMIEFAEAVEPYAGHLSTVPWPLVRFARATLTGNASEKHIEGGLKTPYDLARNALNPDEAKEGQDA